MISITYQTMCISIVVILIVGIIIGASFGGSKESTKERQERKIWTEVSETELKQLGKHKQGGGSKQTPDFMKPKLSRDIHLDDKLFNDDEVLKRINRKKN